MKKKDPKWTPFESAVISDADRIRMNFVGNDDVIFLNSRYQVNIRYLESCEPFGEVWWLSIKRRDKGPIFDWRDMQKIKSELCGAEREAVQVFPAESRHVDTANQYHMFVFMSGYKLPFGFNERAIINSSGAMDNSKQRPLDEHHVPPDLEDMTHRFNEQMTALNLAAEAEKASKLGGST